MTTPKRPIYSTTVTVNVEHTEEAQLEHRALVTLLRQARLEFLKQNHMSEKSIDGNTGMVIRNLNVEYKAPARIGDTLEIFLSIGKRFKKGCEIHYHVRDIATGQTISSAITGIVFVDTKQFKAVPIPRVFENIIRNAFKTSSTVEKNEGEQKINRIEEISRFLFCNQGRSLPTAEEVGSSLGIISRL